MANGIGIAYCGGIMTCSGYSEPKASNLLLDNPRLYEEPNSASTIINNTDADAFVYTYCDRDKPNSGSCVNDSPTSKLYVIKSCCSPKMPCTYYDDVDGIECPKIINDNTNIWAKEVEARYDIPFAHGDYELYEYSAEKLKNMLGVNTTKVTYFSGDTSYDLEQFKENLCDKRYNAIKNYLVSLGAMEYRIRRDGGILENNSQAYNYSTHVIANVSFLPFTDNFSGGSEANLDTIVRQQYNDFIHVTPNITQSEDNENTFSEYIKTKRLAEINNIFGDISNIGFSANTRGSHAYPKISFYAKKSIFSEYDDMTGNNTTRITNYDANEPYHYFTNGVVSAEFSFINDENSKWYSSGRSESYADVPSATTVGMFKDCPTLVTCDIPGQMRYISPQTFMECGKLSSYTTNPDTIDVIDAEAFSASGIKTGIIGRYTVLKNRAFSGATQMDTIYWHNYIPLNNSFSGNVFGYSGEPRCRLDSGYTYFWDDEDIDWGRTGYTIPKEAFKDCHALKHSKFAKGSAHTETITLTDTLYIPSGFTTIGKSAFENCSGLTDIYLNGVKFVKEKAFNNCKNMNVHDTENVIYVGTDAFNRGNNDSREVTVYGGENAWKELVQIDKNAFYDKNIKNGNPYPSSDAEKILSLPKVVSIGENAFSGATIDGYLKITNNVSAKTIYNAAFNSCTISDSTSDGWGLIISGDTTRLNRYYVFSGLHTDKGGVYLRNVDMSDNSNPFANSVINGNVDISACTLSLYAFNRAHMSGLTLYHEGKEVNDFAFAGAEMSGNCNVTAKTFQTQSFWKANISGDCSISANTIGKQAFFSASASTLNLYPISESNCISISEYAFQNFVLTSSNSINLNKVGTFGNYAFLESQISSVILPLGVDISDSCFERSSLSSVSFNNYTNCSSNDGKFEIKDYAFEHCSNLTSINIPSGVTKIGSYSFGECTSLSNVTFNNNSQLTSISDGAFDSNTSLLSITLPNSVTSIGINTFNGCTSLTSIDIPSSVSSIGIGAFNGCASLTSITLGNNVTSINYITFQNCTSLTSITLGNNVSSIQVDAFNGCTSLVEIKCYSQTAPELVNESSQNINIATGGTVHVPSGCAAQYRYRWSYLIDSTDYGWNVEEDLQ